MKLIVFVLGLSAGVFCKVLPLKVNGSDAGLYNKNMFEGDILLSPKSKNGVADKTKLWPLGSVVYKVNSNVGCPSSQQCKILMQAMDHYHQHSCVRFKELSDEPNYVEIFFSDNSGACWSPVGMHGGRQLLSLGQRCWYLGIVIHELGHSIGFWHEMNRPDRDQFIDIYWKNIISGFSTAFNKQDRGEVDILGETFDYKSVMMYDEYAFSKDGLSETIRPRMSGVTIGPIWKKDQLSDSDVRRLQKLYSCSSSKAIAGFPQDVKCNFNANTCGYTNGAWPVWNWRSVNKTDGYVYSSFEGSRSNPGFFMSVSHHALDAADKRGPLGCVRFWHLIQADKPAVLKLSQAYLTKVTQALPDPRTTYELWQDTNNTASWQHVEVPLYVTKPFKLIFESSFSDRTTEGTIALDDIEILYTPCRSHTKVTESDTTPATLTTTERNWNEEYIGTTKDYEEFFGTTKDYEEFFGTTRDYEDFIGTTKDYEEFFGTTKDYDNEV